MHSSSSKNLGWLNYFYEKSQSEKGWKLDKIFVAFGEMEEGNTLSKMSSISHAIDLVLDQNCLEGSKDIRFTFSIPSNSGSKEHG